MQTSEYLIENRETWKRKPAIREIYTDVYRRVAAASVEGTTLEVGGGIGNFKSFAPHVISSDIQFAPWLDLVASGEDLPLANASLDNLVIIDALHHMEQPSRFFLEAERTLRASGRLIIVEPAITIGSWPFYKVHPESFDMAVDPFADVSRDAGGSPYEANQGIATLFLDRSHRNRLEEEFPGMRLISLIRFRFFSYPLSGIFRPWTLIPGWAMPFLLAIEDLFEKPLGRLLGFRMIAVLERQKET